jgi:hypothetical protein
LIDEVEAFFLRGNTPFALCGEGLTKDFCNYLSIMSCIATSELAIEAVKSFHLNFQYAFLTISL